MLLRCVCELLHILYTYIYIFIHFYIILYSLLLVGNGSPWSLAAGSLDNHCNCLPSVADVPHVDWGHTADGPHYRWYGWVQRKSYIDNYQLLFGLCKPWIHFVPLPAQAVSFNLKSICNSSGTSSVWIRLRICIYINIYNICYIWLYIMPALLSFVVCSSIRNCLYINIYHI